MFSAVSWSNYYTAIIILLVFWYLAVVLLYFRKEVFILFSGKYKIPTGKKKKQQESDSEEIAEQEDHSFEELEGIVTDIRHSILEVAGKKVSRDELLSQLKARLTFYGGLHLPAFRVALNNFIIQQAESICGVVFSEDELNAAWETLPR